MLDEADEILLGVGLMNVAETRLMNVAGNEADEMFTGSEPHE